MEYAIHPNDIPSRDLEPALTFSSELYLANSSKWDPKTRQGACEVSSSLGAAFVGPVAWSIADKTLGRTRFGLAAKAGLTILAGGAAKTGLKSAAEYGILEPCQRTSSPADFVWGAVDALSAVAAVKAENTFSSYWRRRLGRSSGAHLSRQVLEDQGTRILSGSVFHRAIHNGLRGGIGGLTGGAVLALPHTVQKHSERLTTASGWARVGGEVASGAILGCGFGGALGFLGTALWNWREVFHLSMASAERRLPGVFPERYRLDVLHVNDGHSGTLGRQSTMEQVAHKVTTQKIASLDEGRSAVLLEMGDAHSGHAAAVVSNTGELEQRILQQKMRVDYFIPGNHVMDTGAGGKAKDVAKWVENMRAIAREENRQLPGLAANVHLPLEPEFAGAAGLYKPYRIFTDPKTGDRVAMIGLVTRQLEPATRKLVDSDLAAAAIRFRGMNFWQAQRSVLSDEAGGALLKRIAQGETFSAALGRNPSATVESLVRESVEIDYLKGWSFEAAQRRLMWFDLSGRHPGATLSELATVYRENPEVQRLSRLFPGRKVEDLREVMCTSPLKALELTLDQVRRVEGVDKAIVLSHLGRANDLKLASEGPQVAAIFGGHSHDLEPLPLWIRNTTTGKDVLVTQAGNGYGWLGEANLVFRRDGTLHRHLSAGRLHVIGPDAPRDREVQSLVRDWMSRTPQGRELWQQFESTHPVTVVSDLPYHGIRGQLGVQTPLGNFLTRAIKEGIQARLPQVNAERQAANLPVFGDRIDATLIQSGGIRSGIASGRIDELTLRNLFLNDKLALVRLSGDQIKGILSYGVHDMPGAAAKSSFSERLRGLWEGFTTAELPMAAWDPSGKFVLTDGLSYSIDRSRPHYMRVRDLMVRNPAGEMVPVEPLRDYTVLVEMYPLSRWASNPMVHKATGRSSGEIPAQWWALGCNIDDGALTQVLKPHPFERGTSREALLQYLRGNSPFGRFELDPSFLSGPVSDISPGVWRAPLRPSFTSSLLSPAISASGLTGESRQPGC